MTINKRKRINENKKLCKIYWMNSEGRIKCALQPRSDAEVLMQDLVLLEIVKCSAACEKSLMKNQSTYHHNNNRHQSPCVHSISSIIPVIIKRLAYLNSFETELFQRYHVDVYFVNIRLKRVKLWTAAQIEIYLQSYCNRKKGASKSKMP